MAQMNKNGDYIVCEIKRQTTKVAYLTKRGGTVIVHDALMAETPRGSYENGVIADVDALHDLLQNFMLDKNLKKTKLIFITESSSIIRRRMTIHKVRKNEIDGLLRYELEDYLGVDMNEYIIQHKTIQTLREAPDSGAFDDEVEVKSKRKQATRKLAKLDMYVCAVLKTIVESYIELAETFGHKIHAIDVQTNVLAYYASAAKNFNAGFIKPRTDVACILNLSANETHVNIYEKGQFCYHFIVNHDLHKYILELQKSLDISEKKCLAMIDDFNQDERTFLKETLLDGYLVASGSDPADILEKVNDCRELFAKIKGEFASAVAEISRNLALYNSSNKLTVDKVAFYGDYSRLKLAESLVRQKFSDADVAIVKKIDCVDVKKSCQKYRDAVGAFVNIVGVFNK